MHLKYLYNGSSNKPFQIVLTETLVINLKFIENDDLYIIEIQFILLSIIKMWSLEQ